MSFSWVLDQIRISEPLVLIWHCSLNFHKERCHPFHNSLSKPIHSNPIENKLFWSFVVYFSWLMLMSMSYFYLANRKGPWCPLLWKFLIPCVLELYTLFKRFEFFAQYYVNQDFATLSGLIRHNLALDK